jgi:hypothetical protein
MLTKTIIALTFAVVATTSLVSAANAQRAQQGVQPFTAAEQNWFDTAEGPERFPRIPK